MDKPLLKIENLKVVFNKANSLPLIAVDNLSFDLYKNECLCIVGESGCGKSVTALSILNLIDSPGIIENGKIIYYNKNIINFSEKELRNIRGKNISMIFQEHQSSLNPVFTIENQLDEMLNVHSNIHKIDRRKIIIDVLHKVGINHPESKLKSYPHELSGGQCQRIMIAMNIICQPDILIADEPTTALDVTIQAQIISLLKKLMNKNKMSIIFITHNLGIVSEIADRIIIMYAGSIMEETTVNQLFEKPYHPYTAGLLKCIPQLDTDKSKELFVIPGVVEKISETNSACKFYNRCYKKRDECLKKEPELIEIRKGHKVRCIFPEV